MVAVVVWGRELVEASRDKARGQFGGDWNVFCLDYDVMICLYNIVNTYWKAHVKKIFCFWFLFLWTADGIRIFSPTKKFHTDLHSPLGLQMAWSKEGTFRAHRLSHAKK